MIKPLLFCTILGVLGGCGSGITKGQGWPVPKDDMDSRENPRPSTAIESCTLAAAYMGRLQYPRAAREKGQEGWVVVTYEIDDIGKAVSLQIADAYPSGVFEAAALGALKGALFDVKGRRGCRQLFNFMLD